MVKPGRNNPPSSRQQLYDNRPWQKVAIDLGRPMPRTQRGNQWILVLSEHFTRWLDAIPLIDATGPIVATASTNGSFAILVCQNNSIPIWENSSRQD